MESDGTPDLEVLFATAIRNKPSRTYSHKVRNGRVVSLPALKPSRNTPTSARTDAGPQLFRVSYSNSWELKPVAETPLELELSFQGGQTNANEDLPCAPDQTGDEPDVPADESGQPEEITSPVPPPGSSHESCESEESEGPEEDDDDDDDDIIILSQRPLGYNPKHDRRTGNGTRSLRRRPFLIFDKTESKGYKQLKNKPQAEKPPTASRFQPGDGFSGREARPNGSNLLTRTGKQSITSPHVGILDLTQSEPPLVKKKRRILRAGINDNSFLSVSKKKARRPLEPKDPNQQRRPSTSAPAAVKKSNSAPNTADKTKTEPTAQVTGPTTDNRIQNIILQIWDSHANMAQKAPPGQEDDVDMILVERSDDIHENPDTASPHPSRSGVGEQDSCETHISVTPPQMRIRGRSVSHESPTRWGKVDGELELPGKIPERVFRRVKTSTW